MQLVLLKDDEEMKQVYLPDSLLDDDPEQSRRQNIERREGVIEMYAAYLYEIGAKVCPHAHLEVYVQIPSRGVAWEQANEDTQQIRPAYLHAI